MKKSIIIILFVLFFAGCTTQQTTSADETLAVETRCLDVEDLCIIGNPGLLSETSVFSSSDVFFSVILRNNLEGQEAKNVVVELRNVGPFKIVEGYAPIDENVDYETCHSSLELGVWEPYKERNISNTPDPQFVDDYGAPFSVHRLGTMYPDEEIEFLWRLKAPSYQEIANVAFPHEFNYVISYDYKTGVLQTVYALSEDEYQRILRVEGTEPTTKGIMTSSVGAIDIQNSVDEPVRVQGEGSQFTLTYQIRNQRSGIPLEPAIFILQYPEGVEHVGSFDGVNSLEHYGYVDLYQASIYYNVTGLGMEGAICLPKSFDENSIILDDSGTAVSGSCTQDFEQVSLSNILAYIREEFPDMDIDYYAPRLVIKYIYPTDLVDELNYLYYQMQTTEEIEISKYYTFRLKTKYRYSFTGDDEILIVPNPESFNVDGASNYGLVWGDMSPLWGYEAEPNSYTLTNNELTMNSGDLQLSSYYRNLSNYRNDRNDFTFLHIVGLKNTGDDNTLYGMDIGYNTMQSHINKIITTGSSYYNVPSGETLYFYGEYPYRGTTGVNDREEQHNIEHLSSSTISELEQGVAEFLNGRSFFEVRDPTGTILSDNDPIGVNFDYNTYNTEDSIVPQTMNILSSLDNETVFRFNPDPTEKDTEVVGIFTSPVDSVISDTLILYFFNDDPDNYHTFTFNISLSNSTVHATGVEVLSDSVIVWSNREYSADDPTADLTRIVAPNSYLKYEIDLWEDADDIISCGVNIGNDNPEFIIDYLDETRTGDDYETVSNPVEDRLIISESISADYKGVVNTCYEYGG